MVIDQPCIITKFHKTVCLKMQKVAKHLLRIHFLVHNFIDKSLFMYMYLVDSLAAWKSDILSGSNQRPSAKHSVHPLTSR